MLATSPVSVSETQALHRIRLRAVAAVVVLLAGFGGLAAGELAVSDRFAAFFALLAVLFPVLVWRLPVTGLVLLPLTSTLVEQFRLPARLPQHLTDNVPLFRSLNSIGVSGLYISPVELMMATVLLTWLAKAIAERRLQIRGSQLTMAVALLVVAVLVAEVRGLTSGGLMSESLNEIRPFLYLAVMFFLASAITTKRVHLQWLLWVAVIGTGFKGLQGTVRYLGVRNIYPRPQEILEHEEAVFMGCFILLVATLWIFRYRGWLRRVATALLPFVLLADMANNRRTAWVIMIAGVALLAVTAWVRLPHRRRLIGATVAGVLVLAAVYVPLFWNSHSVLAEPAQAVRSAVAPDTRDTSSNAYRVIENFNLGIEIRRSFPIGAGFGKPIAQTIPTVDLSKIDPSIAFIPHNTVLYLWLRTGVAGIFIFWWLIGIAVVTALTLVRTADDGIALYATFVLVAIVAFVIEGWYDMGLEAFRLAVLMGALLGALDAAVRLQRSAAKLPKTATRSVTRVAA